MTARSKTPTTKAPDDDAKVFATKRSWDTWLAKHHADSKGLWLKLAKTGSDERSVTYAEALDIALTWGWIDAQKRGFDDAWWLQRFTPRGARSIWSKINRAKVEKLIAAGSMHAPGLAAVDAAKRDGRWDAAYDSPRTAEAPADFTAALAAVPRARDFFAELDSANRYAMLFRIHHAKKPETRAALIEKFVGMLTRSETLHPRRARAKKSAR